MQRLFALAFAAALACRTAAPPVLPEPAGEATIFVPGYKGSFLAEASGERAWITPGQVFSSGDRSLALPFEGQHASPGYGPLHPDGPLTKLSVLVFGVDVYLSFLEFGKGALPGFVAFSYDWRRDLRESGRELCALVERLPARRVSLVAHSMGGLVALHCLQQGAPKVSRVVFAGTPFGGSPLIFRDLVRGDAAGRNRALLSAEALFTFAAAWQLLPRSSDFLGDPAADAFAPAFWLAHGYGVFDTSAARRDGAYRAQLARMLEAHRAHHEALEGFAPRAASLVIIGQGHASVSGLRLSDLDQPGVTDGDGTVTLQSARPGFPHQELLSGKDHLELLRDGVVQQAIKEFVTAK